MNINWTEILSYILTIALGALSIYYKRSAAAQSKAAEIDGWLSEMKNKSASYIAKAEETFAGTQRGGEKFAWVVDSLWSWLPHQMRLFITKDMIGEIVQATFDSMADYAATQLDRAISRREA